MTVKISKHSTVQTFLIANYSLILLTKLFRMWQLFSSQIYLLAVVGVGLSTDSHNLWLKQFASKWRLQILMFLAFFRHCGLYCLVMRSRNESGTLKCLKGDFVNCQFWHVGSPILLWPKVSYGGHKISVTDVSYSGWRFVTLIFKYVTPATDKERQPLYEN